MSFSTLLIFLMSLTGNTANDIVSNLPVQDYFQSRNIDVTIEKMMELAARDPVDAKTSLQQLLALRVLGEDPAKVKKAGNLAQNVKILEEIAAGKKAQDKLGFAKEYAGWALARITDKKMPLPAAGKKLTESALDWFPEYTALVAAVDMAAGPAKFGQTKELRELSSKFVKQLAPKDKAIFYGTVEEIGNVRIDRAALGYVPVGITRNDLGFYRLSGKFDHQRLTQMLLRKLPPKIEKLKGPNNEPITIISSGKQGAAFAFIGDTDVLVGHRIGALGDDDSLALVKQMLEIRAGGKKSVLKGHLADDLSKVSGNTRGLVVGAPPPDLVSELKRGPFSIVPASVIIEVQRPADGVELRFQGKFDKADDAKAFVEDALKLRGQAMIKLKLAKDNPFPVEPILKVLGSIKMEPKDAAVTATLRVSDETLTTLASTLIKWVYEDR